MMKMIVIVLLSAEGLKNTHAQTTPAMKCTCVPLNTCYQNLPSTDGSGVIDIRIVNGGSTTGNPGTPPGIVTCAPGTESCCTPQTGCGVRWNIPLTPSTTPGPGQGKYGSQPWQSVILGLDNTYLGGGVLLNPFNVLTAAHKIANRAAATIKIRMGEWDSNRNVEPYPTQEALVVQIKIHPQFASNNLTNDIAILRLASPIQLGPNPNPAINSGCLPAATSTFTNMRCLVSGWGKDAFTGTFQSIVKEVDVPILNNNDCQDRLRKTRLGPNFVLNSNSFICAGGEAGRDACVGDGGSGLMCNVGGKYQVVGLVAWGIGCADANVPGVYVQVQSFLPWIQSNMA